MTRTAWGPRGPVRTTGEWAVVRGVRAPTASRVITFDDLPLGRPGAELGDVVPNGYAGFDWHNVFYADGAALARALDAPGYARGVTSAPCVGLLSGFDGHAELSRPAPFGFFGGRFAAAFDDGLVLRVTGYACDAVCHAATLVLDTTRAQPLAVRWDAVTRVRLEPVGARVGPQVLFDDLRVDPRVAGLDAAADTPPGLLLAAARPTVFVPSPAGGCPCP